MTLQQVPRRSTNESEGEGGGNCDDQMMGGSDGVVRGGQKQRKQRRVVQILVTHPRTGNNRTEEQWTGRGVTSDRGVEVSHGWLSALQMPSGTRGEEAMEGPERHSRAEEGGDETTANAGLTYMW